MWTSTTLCSHKENLVDSNSSGRSMVSWIYWSLLAATSLHIFEEFVFPGGFVEWYRAYRPAVAASLNANFLVGINALLLCSAAAVGIWGSTPRGAASWLTIAALLFANAWFHIRGAFRTKRYSPGMLTAVTLYIPLAVYGYIHLVSTGKASIGTAISAAIIGGSYPFISAANHARRARRLSKI